MRIHRPIAFALLMIAAVGADVLAAANRLNVLLITADDMSCDSVGVYGTKLKGITPNMDRLAAQSLRFNHAHSQVGNCMPTRNVLFAGRYPHNNRVEGFYQVKNPGYPVMADLMKAGGYFTGIRGKVADSTPYTPYPAWDIVLDALPDGQQADPKNVESYYVSTRNGIASARKAGKPFCLNLNISDPHKPFWNEDGNAERNKPTRTFTANEVPVPGFLFESEVVRKELALYYSSVRRADDCLGSIMRALQESGLESDTLVVFLSDHGMPLPFAKTQLYYHSTRTPLMFRWPGVTKAGTVDDLHVVSFVDMLPTLLEIVGLPQPNGIDGRSFVPVLRGETQANREFAVTEYNENSAGFRHPMRSIVTRGFAYIFNPWSNGQRAMSTHTKSTDTYRWMRQAAKTDPKVAARLNLFDHRVPEELYDYSRDPDALQNLIADSKYRGELARLTGQLESWMARTGDPLLEVFRNRADPQVREEFMQEVEKNAEERRTSRTRKKNE